MTPHWPPGLFRLLARIRAEAEAAALERAAQTLAEAAGQVQRSQQWRMHFAQAAAVIRALANGRDAVLPGPPNAARENFVEDMKPRDPGCECTIEEGDSPCPVHGNCPVCEDGLLADLVAEDGASLLGERCASCGAKWLLTVPRALANGKDDG